MSVMFKSSFFKGHFFIVEKCPYIENQCFIALIIVFEIMSDCIHTFSQHRTHLNIWDFFRRHCYGSSFLLSNFMQYNSLINKKGVLQ